MFGFPVTAAEDSHDWLETALVSALHWHCFRLILFLSMYQVLLSVTKSLYN